MSIVATDSIASFFDEVVEDALKARHVEASQSATRYIVGVLADYAHPEGLETFGRPLALSLQEALIVEEPGKRFERLRKLGDAVLYASGFFADHFAARGLEPRYVTTIGSRAYETAGTILAPGSGGLFEELANRFGEFALVMSEVADMTGLNASTSAGLLKLYERWLKTGSERVAGALGEHGIYPGRKTSGLQ